MSTILHPVQNRTWWLAAAAAALATGLLIVLMTTVLGRTGSVDTTPPPIQQFAPGHAYAVPCFAGHSSMSIELVRSGCRA
jgi:hypothetical protein